MFQSGTDIWNFDMLKPLLELLKKSSLSVSKELSSEYTSIEERVDLVENLHRLSSLLNSQKLEIGRVQAEYVRTDHDLWVFCYYFAKERERLEEAFEYIKRASDLLWGQEIIYTNVSVNLCRAALDTNRFQEVLKESERLLNSTASNGALAYFYDQILRGIEREKLPNNLYSEFNTRLNLSDRPN